MANEFNIKNGFISKGNSSVEGSLSANTIFIQSITSGTSVGSLSIDSTGKIISGSTGANGTSGSSGTSGINGSSGTSGINGSSGTSGIDGSSGTSGINGSSGTSGVSGTSGIDGTSGTSGVNGLTGTSGIDGTSGSSGTSGFGTSGTSGINGSSGTSGVSGSTGRFGISDSGGTYTYYSALTEAMSAATSGQTIEMFTDYTETGSVTITLKNGVNINGNGHTYNYTNATGNCFIDNGVAVVCSILNLVVNRTSHSSGNVWTITSASSNIDFLGSKTYLTSSTTGYAASLNGTIINLWIKSTGASISGTFGGILQNCYVETTGSGYGITQLFPNAIDCIGISASGRGFYIYEDGTLIRCYGKSTSGYGIFAETSGTNILLYNCLSLSSSGVALYLRGCKVYNNIAVSSSNVAINCAFGNNQIFNTTARSSSSYAINGVAGDVINNSSAISDGSQSVLGISVRGSSIINNWDNASGHSYLTPSASSEIANNFMIVTNASANCIYNSLAVSVKYANNSFKGATTPVNANITQAILNTQDNQGNILL